MNSKFLNTFLAISAISPLDNTAEKVISNKKKCDKCPNEFEKYRLITTYENNKKIHVCFKCYQELKK